MKFEIYHPSDFADLSFAENDNVPVILHVADACAIDADKIEIQGFSATDDHDNGDGQDFRLSIDGQLLGEFIEADGRFFFTEHAIELYTARANSVTVAILKEQLNDLLADAFDGRTTVWPSDFGYGEIVRGQKAQQEDGNDPYELLTRGSGHIVSALPVNLVDFCKIVMTGEFSANLKSKTTNL